MFESTADYLGWRTRMRNQYKEANLSNASQSASSSTAPEKRPTKEVTGGFADAIDNAKPLEAFERKLMSMGTGEFADLFDENDNVIKSVDAKGEAMFTHRRLARQGLTPNMFESTADYLGWRTRMRNQYKEANLSNASQPASYSTAPEERPTKEVTGGFADAIDNAKLLRAFERKFRSMDTGKFDELFSADDTVIESVDAKGEAMSIHSRLMGEGLTPNMFESRKDYVGWRTRMMNPSKETNLSNASQTASSPTAPEKGPKEVTGQVFFTKKESRNDPDKTESDSGNKPGAPTPG